MSCKNCNFEFQQAESSICPRCSSKHVVSLAEKTSSASAPSTFTPSSAPRHFGGPVVGESKESWKRFHGAGEPFECTYCGGKEFEMNWKKREKTCKKCGNVGGLKRRAA